MQVTVLQHAEKERTAGDPGLTARGHDQALSTAERLSGESIDAIWCSPLRRTRLTAAPLSAAAALPAVMDARLMERMNWDGLEPLNTFLEDWDLATRDRSYQPRSGESSARTAGRMLQVLWAAATAFPAGHVVLVTHGGVTVDGLRTVLGDDTLSAVFPAWSTGVPACALTRIDLQQPLINLRSIADVGHLRTQH